MPPGKRPGPVPFILEVLACAYSSARVVLRYRTPFELLVATVLAAQCTDDRVNQVTPALFVRFPGPEAFAAASLPEIEEAVRPTGFYRNKAGALKGIGSALVARHGGNVPESMEELTALPGVGRKTASVILGACFGVDALPVDTHVGRVSFRLGLTRSKDPARIEEDLAEAVPKGRWDFATQLGWHGRQVCVARQPRCGVCGLSRVCPRNGVTRSA
ncbi:MAG: endonuclease III [Deltaproteobacteria bacterium]|jgi:endonuclease-3|nr:endonuclease III [Deltaproteobacteria bacterium]